MSFTTLGLSEELASAVTDLNFVQPTPIQEKAIPLLTGELTDFLGLAQTGTGKTAAFGLPLLQWIDVQNYSTQALVICPTRELCIQIEKDLRNFSKYLPKLRIVSVYGGTNIGGQIRELRRGAHIICATPGRLVDLLNRKKAELSDTRVVVLDEADEMLNMGFKDELDAILMHTPETKKTWLFSATMPKEVEQMSKNYMNSPKRLSVGGANRQSQNISHSYYLVQNKHRFDALKRIIDANPSLFGVVFCRTKSDTRDVAEQLCASGHSAEALHGDLSQARRDEVMNAFRKGTVRILVATDVAARGIDVSNVTHVIHHRLPDDPEVYTHRSGRTGRAGNTGESISLVSPMEMRLFKNIQRFVKTDFQMKRVPTPHEICDLQLKSYAQRIANVEIEGTSLEPFMDIFTQSMENLSKEEIIARVAYDKFQNFLEYYQNAPSLSTRMEDFVNNDRGGDKGRGDRRKGGDRFRNQDANYQRFFANIGNLDGLNHGALIRILCDRAKISSKNIGSIDIKQSYSFFDVENSHAQKVMNPNSPFDLDGKNFKVEMSNKRGRSSSSNSSNDRFASRRRRR